MRSALSELPVLLCCVRGGLIAGAVSAALRLPGKLLFARLRGRRERALPRFFRALLDVLAAAALSALAALTLYEANGGEPRLYALCGFAAGAVITARALETLAAPGPKAGA